MADDGFLTKHTRRLLHSSRSEICSTLASEANDPSGDEMLLVQGTIKLALRRAWPAVGLSTALLS